jgi:hypothetical protein
MTKRMVPSGNNNPTKSTFINITQQESIMGVCMAAEINSSVTAATGWL